MPSFCTTLVKSSGLSKTTFRVTFPLTFGPPLTLILPSLVFSHAGAYWPNRSASPLFWIVPGSYRQDDFAELLALLHTAVRLDGFGQREDAVDHRMQVLLAKQLQNRV